MFRQSQSACLCCALVSEGVRIICNRFRHLGIMYASLLLEECVARYASSSGEESFLPAFQRWNTSSSPGRIMNGMKIVQSLGMFGKASVTATARALRKCIGGSLASEDMARIKKKDLLYR